MAEMSQLPNPRFFCREWAFAKLWACLEQRSSAKTGGVLVLGSPGTGKTAFCRQIIRPVGTLEDAGSINRHSSSLQERVLAHHFCQASNVHSLSVGTFIQKLVGQLSASPHLNGYSSKVTTDEVTAALTPESLRQDPDEALKRAVLFPLLELDAPESPLFLLVDSIDETSHTQAETQPMQKGTGQSGSSGSIAELLAAHHHLFPQWLLMVLTTRRSSRHVTKCFSGFRKIALDDLRRNHVVRDVQQYILCRLDTEPALRHHLSRETAEMLNQLHIKSNGCILYLQKVLDGVVEGWVTLREIRDIPGTLNGLYLWLCQRLFPKKLFQKVVPLLSVILAARTPLSSQELKEAVSTKFPEFAEDEEWDSRSDLLRKVLHSQHYNDDLVLFHQSFAEWLLDVKHCTPKYLVNSAHGHAMLAMKYTTIAPSLSPQMVQEFAFHLSRVPLEGQLQWYHLPLWLVSSNAGLKDLFSSYIINDHQALTLLKDTGAVPPTSTPTNTEAPEEKPRPEKEIIKEALVELTPKVEELVDLSTDPQPLVIQASPELNTVLKESLIDAPVTSSKSEAILRKSSSQSEQVLSDNSFGMPSEFSLGAIERKRSSSVGRGSSRSRHCSSERSTVEISDRRRKSGEDNFSSNEGIHSSFGSHEGSQQNSPSAHHRKRTTRPEESRGDTKDHRHREHRRHREDPLHPYLRGGPVDQIDAAGRTLLHTASHQGDASLVTLLLERGANLSLADRNGQTPLNLASRHGHAEVVSTLLVFGANPDHADDDGWTALRSAAWAGHYEVVLSLLNGHAKVDLSDGDGRTALRAAAWGGHEDVVAALLRTGADINSTDADGRTPLIAAAYMGHAEIVEALIAGGADVNHHDRDWRTALSVAALCAPASEGHLQVVTALLEAGARVDNQDKDGLTPLLVAAFEGHVDVCELLLDYESDVDHVDRFNRTPLLAAASMGHSKVVEKLLFWGCYVDHIDFEGRTVLSVAAAQGCPETVRLLLDRGLDETHRDNAGWTPLHYAAFEGHAGVVGSLINAGARVNEVDNDGKHSLVLAAHEGHVDVVTTLLDAGGSLDHTSHDGRSALRVAALEGHAYVVKELVSRGANINYRDADGRTTLYLLALEDRLDMASFLLRAGAGVDDTDLDGRTPLHVTAWQGHSRMVELLVAHGARVDALDKERRTPLQSAAWQGHAHVLRILLEAGARVDHACVQGASALSIAAQEGHEQCVSVLLQFGANPAKADGCGRTAIKVALKGGHTRLAKLLEDLERPPCRHPGHLDPHTPTSPTQSPESTLDKRRSISSNLSSSTRSSGVATGHRPPVEPPYAPRTAAPIPHQQPTVLSFTQQLQACGLGRRPPTVPPPVLTPLEDDPASPIYASPPTTPTSPSRLIMEDEYALPVKSKDHMKHSTGSESHPYCPTGTPPLAAQADAGFTFTQDTHMRIILGARSSPESRSRSKRNGIVTNPSLKAAQAKAANIFRNGLHGRPRTPDRSSGRKKETPL